MAIDVVVEEVAGNLEEIASATRKINTHTMGFFLGGLAVGAVVGFYVGYRYNKEKLKLEAFKQSEEEVAKIREQYQQKMVAATPKPSAEEIVEEKGYDKPQVTYDRPLPAPVPGVVEPEATKPEWDYEKELERRTKSEPYVIHQDEFVHDENGYNHVVYTYYAGDDVMVDEENGHPLPHADIVVGLNNLQFGHGTDDDDVVFVRNDRLEIEMEICRTQDSYEEKILGIENTVEDDEDTD